jgi:predicted nucleic acid-binding protein
MASNAAPRALRALADTNVVLDQLLQREPWYSEAQSLWHARDSGGIVLYVPASTLTDIFYIGRRLVGLERAREAVGHCLDQLGIIPVDRAVLQAALLVPGPDFEDNVQIACAQVASLDLIVTRNAGDFRHATVPVVAPAAVAGYRLP